MLIVIAVICFLIVGAVLTFLKNKNKTLIEIDIIDIEIEGYDQSLAQYLIIFCIGFYMQFDNVHSSLA